MFTLNDNFSSYGSNRQPYSFEIEQHTYVDNMHSAVEDKKFHLKSIGNRHILKTPAFTNGCFRMDFAITVLQEFDPEFTVFFDYDKGLRNGLGIRVRYKLDGSLQAELVEHIDHKVNILDTRCADDFKLQDSTPCTFVLYLTSSGVHCKIGEIDFEFQCERKGGYLAIERDNFIGDMFLENVCFESDDDFETDVVLKPVTAEIPLVNGGDIPYKVTWSINKVQDDYYLACVLDGGTGTRPCNKSDRPGQYSVQNAHMTSPFVGVINSGKKQVFDIAAGDVCFVDPNIFWQCQKDIFKSVDLPLTGFYRLDPSLVIDGIVSPDAQLVFGYEKFSCNGYTNQSGEREFHYDTKGTLTYNGVIERGQDIFEIFSPFDKYAMTLIPEDCYKREDVVNHIKYNHYFERSENIRFSLEFRTMLDISYADIEAEIIDIYESETLATASVETSSKISDSGYSHLRADAAFGTLDTGVYKVLFKVFYGGKLYKQTKCVFEVFDKDNDDIPALKSGLPFIFSSPNEIKWLERNAFDLWNPMPSCDGVHYISCVTDTPIEAERRETWRLTKPFKRKWYAWIAPRTCRDFGDIENHIETVKNVDYLFWANTTKGWSLNCQYTQFPLRSDHWSFVTTKSPFQQEVLKAFLTENPEAAKVVAMDFENEEFTNDHYERLMSNYREEWIAYMNEHVLKILRAQNEQLKKINPNIKRSMYGPVNIYVTPTISYRSLADYGLPTDESLANDVFDGFAVFEDYPHACSYPTYRGPFTLTSMLLHCPGLTVYPEQYSSGRGGSIDGAVKFANAPFGAYKVAPYQNSTHSYEYVFNTAYLADDGYHYWDTYGFHRRSHSTQMLDELAKDWKYVIDNKPQKPLRSMAFIAQYDESDTEFHTTTNSEGNKFYAFCNQSELASGVIYECSREAGIPNGFSLKFDTLSKLDADSCDLIVVPTLKGAPDSAVAELRRLYNEGVNLIALSDVTGLEDIFGVKSCESTHSVTTITYSGQTENIYPTEAKFNYTSDGATVVAHTDGEMPAVFATSRTALINTAITSLGLENKEQRENRPNAYNIVGTLIRQALSDILAKLSKPLAYGIGAGVTLFEAAAGHTCLMAINYTPYDNYEHTESESVVRFDMPDLVDVQSDKELFVCKKDGIVKEIRFTSKPSETLFAKLIFDK